MSNNMRIPYNIWYYLDNSKGKYQISVLQRKIGFSLGPVVKKVWPPLL